MATRTWTTGRSAVVRLAVSLAVSLTACGGGGGGGADAGSGGDPNNTALAGADYLPLNVGDVWYLNSATSGPSVTRVTGTRVVDGRNVVVTTTTDNNGTVEQLYERTASGVMEVLQGSPSSLDRALALIPTLGLPLVAGQTSVPLNQTVSDAGDLDGDGRSDSVVLRAEVTVLGFESLVTPAGSWSRVAKVRTVLTEAFNLSLGNRQVTVTGTQTEWFAPNVGAVRSEYTVTGGGNDSSDQWLLQAFRAGGLRSEIVAPTILTRNPAAGNAATTLSLSVGFSEAMDTAADASNLIMVTAPGGGRVAGTVAWVDERTLAFTPSAAAASGNYQVEVAAATQDRVANGLVGDRSWSITVDRQGPQVLSVSPASGAVEVPLNSTVQINFDEVPAGASVSTQTVQLQQGGNAVPATVALSGRSVTITPTLPLQRGQVYGVVLAGVTDPLGNLGAGGEVGRFTADPGRLGAATMLPSGLAHSQVVAGDFNGDGRSDVVALAFDDATRSQVQVVLYRQLADGTLAAPVTLAFSATCGLVNLSAGDVDGDGRTDLLINHACGTEVLRQTTAGELASAGLIALNTYKSQLLRTATRPALVGWADAIDQRLLQFWTQDDQGRFNAASPVPIALSLIYDVHVADLNGDGLDDLVFWGPLSNGADIGVEVHLQVADGSFGPAREFAGGSCGGAHGVASGDVNGDGRRDLVLVSAGCLGGDRVAVLLQDTTGGYGAARLLPAAMNLQDVAVRDMDGDGRADIVTLHGTLGVGIYLQAADGGLAAETLYAFQGAGWPWMVQDVTGDGRADVVVAGALMRQKPALAGAALSRVGRRAAAAARPPLLQPAASQRSTNFTQ